MYTFSQLLFRNIITALIFTLLTTVSMFYLLSTHFNTLAKQERVNIEQLATKVLPTNNAKFFADILQHTDQYSFLSIRTYSKQVIAEYKDSDHKNILSFLLPKPTVFSDKSLNIDIKFSVNHRQESQLILNISIITFILSLIIAFIAAKQSIKQHNLVFNTINKQIKKGLAQIKSQKNNSDESNNVDDFLDIPELKQGITNIKALLTEQALNSASLEVQAYTDQLTKLDNRGRFVQFYEEQVMKDSPVKFGVLLITRCSELQTVNQIHGFNEGDNYISKVANILKSTVCTQPNAQIFRLNSSDFATIIPNIQLQQAEDIATELTDKFNSYQHASDLDSIAYTGLVFFDKSNPLGELLALADTAISIAQTQKLNSWFSQKDTDILQSTSAGYGNQNWRQEIESVLVNKRIKLLIQPILPSGRNNKVYSEVLARFISSNDEMLPTASFIAMAEKLDKIVAVDQLIIETTISLIINQNITDQSFGINLSSRSINDEHFLIWLERKLLREPSVSTRLIFEITEQGLQQNIKTSKRLIDMLHRVGARVTVERFGVGLTSFKFFRELKPDYIKMDSTYTRDIDDDKNNQYFLRLMVDLAHRLGINVLAESVESQEEKHTLEKLFLDGYQGFYIGKPKAL